MSYNGFPFTLTAAGCQRSAADRMGPGYITRAVLVDMPLMKNVKWLEPSTPIYAEDLEAWEKFAGLRIGAGDALLIRGGRWAKREAEGPWPYGQAGAGLHASVLPWLRARDVRSGERCGDDVQPSGFEGINRPIHQLTQVTWGYRSSKRLSRGRRGRRRVEAVAVHVHPAHSRSRGEPPHRSMAGSLSGLSFSDGQ